MELLTLDSSFQATKIVDSYDSLIWTERYSAPGDFQIVMTDVARAIQMMPLESCVALRESSVPMIVEAHKIEKQKGKPAQITITGRSYETVLERRVSVSSTFITKTSWLITAMKESDAAFKIMQYVLGDPSRGVTALASPNDAIPQVSLTQPVDYQEVPTGWVTYSATTAYTAGTLVKYNDVIYNALQNSTGQTPSASSTYWSVVAKAVLVERTNLYSVVNNLISVNHHGLKAVRPGNTGSQVGLEIYNGADLTNEVIINARFEEFDDATYLMSKMGSANVAYVFGTQSSSGASLGSVVLKNAAAEPLGLNRRVILVDLGSDPTVNTPEARRSRGLIELYKLNEIAMFDGQISTQIASGFNHDYFLGDIIKLQGEYGISEDVRVVEFIRTSDSSGEKQYPTFEVIDETT